MKEYKLITPAEQVLENGRRIEFRGSWKDVHGKLAPGEALAAVEDGVFGLRALFVADASVYERITSGSDQRWLYAIPEGLAAS